MSYTASTAPFLDAIALIEAVRRHDGEQVHQIAETADMAAVARVLAQMMPSAIRTQGFTVEAYLEMQTEKTISHMYDDGDPFAEAASA